MEILLSNTLSKAKEIFTPLKNKTVKMYVCGITPYDLPHLGHGRVYVTFDILYRLLLFFDYDVTYARNFTDIDDKIIQKAATEDVDYTAIANRYIDAFHENMTDLNCLSPHYEPRVTNYIDEIIEFIEQLIKQNKAYVLGSDVYFDISSFESYGKLSKRTLEELDLGSRVEINHCKKHPADFALWKGNDQQEFWRSPWGYGRPGWHIECSVMAYKILGETIDIHGGGMDLIFPHHENEIAQSEACLHQPFTRYWVHNAFININKEKMSKSLGNFITLKAAFQSINPMIIRFFFIQHHYNKPIDFDYQELDATATAYKKIVSLLTPFPSIEMPSLETVSSFPIALQLLQALCDDLNTPRFLGLFFEHQKAICADPELGAVVKYFFQHLLGLTLHQEETLPQSIPAHIQALLEEREEARREKNWAQADALRKQIQSLGYDVQDQKSKK